ALVDRITQITSGSPFRVGGELLTVRVSAGGSIVRPGDDASALLERADDAMYDAKGVAVGDRPARARTWGAPTR
ncbi:MAG TPA: hypothetical protein VGK17_08775, partial [Propionicimonas sp.]